MSFALLLSKSVLVPAGGALVVGAGAGGAYYVYTNRTTSSQSTSNNETAPIKTNAFLARVKGTATGTLTTDSTFKCEIETSKEVDCKILKFVDAQTHNAITKFEQSKITAIANISDLVTGNYVFVEVSSEALTFAQLKNKTITLKSGASTIVTLEFDQLLVKSTESNKAWYEPIAAITDTYIVSTPSTLTTPVTGAPTIPNFRCKYRKTSETTQIDNIDDSCKLITIPAPGESKTITSLEEVKAATTTASDLAVSTFYKLTLNRNQLYNLDLIAAKTDLTVELTVASQNKSSTLTIHQQLIDSGFVGKTDLILGKVKVTKTTAAGTVTNTQCTFSNATPPSGHFPCQLHKADLPSSGNDLHNLTLTSTAVANDEAFEVDKYFLIKLTTPLAITELTKGKNIYYQISKTPVDSTAQYETVSLEITELLSGDFTDSKKPLYITNYSSQPTA